MVESKGQKKSKITTKSRPGVFKTEKKTFPFCYTTEEKRLKAFDAANLNFSQTDPVLQYLISHAEDLFSPKMVFTPSDWLETRKE